ncbi:hypothetical protein F5X98DRAFT_384910 [Xylaria grammica]|nr:hypothetical protein F5X98DRAFT_384910 [Xylaria grammica]
MEPSLLDDPTFKGYSSEDPPIDPRLKRPMGKPYKPQDSGPPLWAEEQLVVLNLWRLQYYYDIRVAHDGGHLEWLIAEQEELQSMTLAEFYSLGTRGNCKYEQLVTVLMQVQGAKIPEQEMLIRPFRLPYPATPG